MAKVKFEMSPSDVQQVCIESVKKMLPRPIKGFWWDIRLDERKGDGGVTISAEQKYIEPDPRD